MENSLLHLRVMVWPVLINDGVEWEFCNEGLLQKEMGYWCGISADVAGSIVNYRVSEKEIYVIRALRYIIHTTDEGETWEYSIFPG